MYLSMYKMDKFLEALALIAVGGVVYLTVENSPTIKKAVANIVPITPRPTDIVPISTTRPRDDRPPPPRGTCPPGYSPDYTLGILRCHDPHGTRELNPNVKLFSPQWANAWGSPGECINCTTPGQPGIGGQPGAPGIPGQPGRCYQDGVQVPCDSYFYDDAFAEPNMTQPLVEPDINKQIESQIKKQHEREVKRQKKPDQKKEVHTQIECPSDLSKLKCGSNCYKDGKLYKVTCSEAEREALFPPKKKKSSITIPAHFPHDVTISPGTDEEPYPSEDTTVTDTAPGGDIPLTDLPGGQQPIFPTIPPTAPTPIARPPPLQPIPPSPPLIPPAGNVFYPFRPATNSSKKGFADHPYNSDGCRVVDYHSGGSGWTCRWQADNNLMRSKIGENGYKIETSLHIGGPKTEKDKEISITSGGPGSTEGNCCGFTTRINIDTGTLQLEAEGPAHTEVIYCKGKECVASGPTSIGTNLYGKDVKLTWIVTRQGTSATYQAIATGPSGTVVSKKFTNPQARGKAIIPFHYIAVSKVASDPHRVRVDSADMKAVYFGNPRVTVLPANAYYGEEGYIDNPEFLI